MNSSFRVSGNLNSNYRPFNPSSTVFELVQHLKLSKATLIICHEANLHTAYAAAREVGIPSQRVIILEDQDISPSTEKVARGSATAEQLIESGIRMKSAIVTRLVKGEGKTQVAFYNSSSGTTGAPKVKMDPRLSSEYHYIHIHCFVYLDYQDLALFNYCQYPPIYAYE